MSWLSDKGVKESGRTRVYRRIVEQLATDPVLEPLGIQWICFDGKEKKVRRVSSGIVVSMIPVLGPMQTFSSTSQQGDLIVNVQITIPNRNFDACDCLDLWTAIEQAIYPFDDHEKQLAFEAALRGGDDSRDMAYTGRIAFTNPATVNPATIGNGVAVMELAGSFSVSIDRTFIG